MQQIIHYSRVSSCQICQKEQNVLPLFVVENFNGRDRSRRVRMSNDDLFYCVVLLD